MGSIDWNDNKDVVPDGIKGSKPQPLELSPLHDEMNWNKKMRKNDLTMLGSKVGWKQIDQNFKYSAKVFPICDRLILKPVTPFA